MRSEFAICLAILSMFWATSCVGEQCECEDGVYHAIYYPVDSTCGSTQFASIPIEYRYSQIGKWSLQVTNFNYRNETQISYQGCSLGLAHKVLVTDQVTQHESLIFLLQGQLNIEESKRLSGRLGRVEFNREDQSEICRGTYDVVLTKIGELQKTN